MPTRPPRLLRLPLALGATLTCAALVTGCGSSATDDAGSGSAKLAVVASTNVYGNIAEDVGGSDISVTSILSNPDQDPHSFEASPRTALAISKADLLIENGGGYDDYMTKLRSSTRSDAPVIDVVKLSGKTAPSGGELNEHVWYDFTSMKLLADDLAQQLGQADPDDADAFKARAQTFKTKLDALIAEEGAAEQADRGKAVGITEPVPLYLTQALGLTNKTPAKFSEAVEEGTTSPRRCSRRPWTCTGRIRSTHWSTTRRPAVRSLSRSPPPPRPRGSPSYR